MKKLLLITLMLALGLTGFSQTKTWDPQTGNSNWDIPSNWNPPGVPGQGDNVIIPEGKVTGSTRSIIFTGNAVCHDLQIDDIGALDNWGTLTYTGDVNVEGELNLVDDGIMKYEPMTSIVVTSNADDGPYTLRRAIEYIGDGGTITFNLPTGQEDIFLESEIEINKSLTIDGANTAGSGVPVTVYGDGTHRIFHIPNTESGKTFNFKNMEIRDGNSTGIGGGGILCLAGTLIVDNVYFFQNDATGTGDLGGGIYVNGSTCNITNSTFNGNFSDDRGGGIYAVGAYVTITGCTFSNNKADGGSINGGGGAIFVFQPGGSISIINSTFSSNSAPNGSGGAIHLTGDVVVNMKFTTVSNNSAGLTGGGVYLLFIDHFTIQNCMLGNNSAVGDGDDFATGLGLSKVTDHGYNIVEDSHNYSWNATGDITGEQANLFGAGLSSQTLADNGGPTQTLAIVDVYSAAWYAGKADGDVTTDQRGTVRQDPPTIGAFDYPATTVASSGEIWMDRNLGASQVATKSDDALAYGDLYQWGRFREGHHIRTSSVHNGQATTPVPNAGNDWDSLFLTPHLDWLTPHNNNLWQGEAGVNNPCPDGFRLPTGPELEAERLSWDSNDAAGAYASPLKLTVGGYRHNNDATIRKVDVIGLCWSSTVSTNYNVEALRIDGSGGGDTHVKDETKAFGFSVRCIKDD